MMMLQKVKVNIFEMARLFECKQIINMWTRSRHPTKVAISRVCEVEILADVFLFKRTAESLNERGVFRVAKNGESWEYLD
ncbi:MAG: hypothetical protein ACXAEN_21645 [Candidatus Thorarchaeota archaeon]|jgi:hypothetical protein